MKTILLSAITALSLAVNPKAELLGKWESRSENGTTVSIVFKENKSFEGFVNKKPFVSGTYSFTQADSLFTFVDNGCAGITGIYKIIFYSNSDSLRFGLVNDSCTRRATGMQRLSMGRIIK